MPLRVAILGGGIAGATLMHALVHNQPQIQVDIFESASNYLGAGSAISVNKNTKQALSLISPAASQSLLNADGKHQKGIIWSLGTGPDAGKDIDRLDETAATGHVVTVVQRAKYLQSILKGVPTERMHANKKLVKFSQSDSIRLEFADGSTHECDVLIGADGIHSTIREYITAESGAQQTEWYAIWTMRPYKQARAIMGDIVDVDNAYEHMWLGQDTFIIHEPANEEMVQVVGVVREPSSETQWVKQLDLDEEKRRWSTWPSNLSQALLTFLGEEESPAGFRIWEHPPAKTYVKGNVAIMGDAAHSTTPWQGAGGGMGIEDALILSNLLGLAKNGADAAIALQVYDEVRRPRTQQIVQSSNAVGKLETGQTVPLTLEHLKNNMAHRWLPIFDLDNEAATKEAVDILSRRLASA